MSLNKKLMISQVCKECYSSNDHATPLLNARLCLEKHTQYICGTCGRMICIEHDPIRGLQRWQYPFKSLDEAILYLRTADYTMKKPCGIYELINNQGKTIYKIFIDKDDLQRYLNKNKQKTCYNIKPVYQKAIYQEFSNTEIRRITEEEINQYLNLISDK